MCITFYQFTKRFSGQEKNWNSIIVHPTEEGDADLFTVALLHNCREEDGNPIDHKDFSLTIVCINDRDTQKLSGKYY